MQLVIEDAGRLDAVVIELTERAPVDNYEALREALEPIRARGGMVAVDDAGAGYASLQPAARPVHLNLEPHAQLEHFTFRIVFPTQAIGAIAMFRSFRPIDQALGNVTPDAYFDMSHRTNKRAMHDFPQYVNLTEAPRRLLPDFRRQRYDLRIILLHALDFHRAVNMLPLKNRHGSRSEARALNNEYHLSVTGGKSGAHKAKPRTEPFLRHES